jgi:hypothetical protein
MSLAGGQPHETSGLCSFRCSLSTPVSLAKFRVHINAKKETLSSSALRRKSK